MPKTLETPAPTAAQGSSHRTRIHGRGFAGSTEGQSRAPDGLKWPNRPRRFLSLLYNIVNTTLFRACSHHRIRLSNADKAAANLSPRPRYTQALPRPPSTCTARCDSCFAGPSQTDEQRRAEAGLAVQQPRATGQDLLANMLALCLSSLSKPGQSACAKPRHLRGSWSDAARAPSRGSLTIS